MEEVNGIHPKRAARRTMTAVLRQRLARNQP